LLPHALPWPFKNGVATLACAGHPRLCSRQSKDVDGRNKSGHDENEKETEKECIKVRSRAGRRSARSRVPYL